MRDGGAKPAAQNAGIGAGKGTGMFVLNTVRSALSTGTPVWAGVGPGAMTVAPAIPTPAVLKPSNQTQAEVSTATQGTLMVASVLITGGRSGPSAAANAQGALDLGIRSWKQRSPFSPWSNKPRSGSGSRPNWWRGGYESRSSLACGLLCGIRCS